MAKWEVGAEGGIVSEGIAQVIDGQGNPLFPSDDSSNRDCFSLSLCVGIRLGLS
jgi:hypothetical protein